MVCLPSIPSPRGTHPLLTYCITTVLQIWMLRPSQKWARDPGWPECSIPWATEKDWLFLLSWEELNLGMKVATM